MSDLRHMAERDELRRELVSLRIENGRLRNELADARNRAFDEAALRIDCNCNERCLSQTDHCPKQAVAAIKALKAKP